MDNAQLRAVLLPGGGLPAGLAFARLLDHFTGQVDARAKDLEIYAQDSVPVDRGLEFEVEGVAMLADKVGFDRFHLLGYSGGGAIALAFCCLYPERLLSLTLAEPAWAGTEGMTQDEANVWVEFDRIMTLPPEDMRLALIKARIADGVKPPTQPTGPQPGWMAKRPAGITWLGNAFKAMDFDHDRFRAFERPVLFTLGGLSNPDDFARMASRLARVFKDFTLEVFEERHHFDPPHLTEPARYAQLLQTFWSAASFS